MLEAIYVERFRRLVNEWRIGEATSPYGLDEHGTPIPMRDGNQCADELERILAEIVEGQ